MFVFSLVISAQSRPSPGKKPKSGSCSHDDSELKLPAGFCATVFAEGIGHARHLVVSPSGVVYVNTWSGDYYDFDKPHDGGFLVALQDKAGTGKADVIQRFGESAQTGGAGGVGIGGVLEPIQAAPVIVEDNAFIGSRCIIVEGVRIGSEAVLGANVVLTASSKIIDVTGAQPVEYKNFVPPRSVVIPGTLPKNFPAGEFQVPCALIICVGRPSRSIYRNPVVCPLGSVEE